MATNSLTSLVAFLTSNMRFSLHVIWATLLLAMGCSKRTHYDGVRAELVQLHRVFGELVLCSERLQVSGAYDTMLSLRDQLLETNQSSTFFFSTAQTNTLICVNPDTTLWRSVRLPKAAAEGILSMPSSVSNQVAVCSPVPLLTLGRVQTNYLALTFGEHTLLLATLPSWASAQNTNHISSRLNIQELSGLGK
jgi:hypothetical protein